jgi:hypothetical protein
VIRLAFRIAAGALLVFLGLAAVSYMQKRFDGSDERKALEAVRARVPDLADPASCRAEVKSRALGDVRVVCGERSWIVNILSARIAEIAEEHADPAP